MLSSFPAGVPRPHRDELVHCRMHGSRTAFCCWNIGKLPRDKGGDVPGEGNIGELVKGSKVGSAVGKVLVERTRRRKGSWSGTSTFESDVNVTSSFYGHVSDTYSKKL